MKKEKIGIFRQLWITFFRPDQYGRLTSSGTGRMIGFVFLFSFLYAIVWIGSLLVTLDTNGIKQAIRKEVPDFYLENGELHLEDPYNLVASNQFICADSEIERFELSDLEYIRDNANYEGILLISKKNLLIYTKKDGKYQQLNFSDFKGEKYTRDGLLDMGISFIKKVSMIAPFIASPFLAIVHFIATLFFALIAMLFSALFGKGLSGGQVYRIGIHVYAVILVAGLIFEVYLPMIPTSIAQFVYFILGAAYLLVGVLSTGSYVSAQRQEMAQRAASPYGGYGEALGYYGQGAFSNEPIGYTVQENRAAGAGANENQYYGGNVNDGGGSFAGMSNRENQFYNGNTYGSASSNDMGSNTGQEDKNSYGMNMAFYGMNVIGRDGTLQTVNPVENKSEKAIEETAEANEESYISHHTGLATNVISFESTEVVQAYSPAPEPAKDTVVINGMECQKSDLDLVDKYLLVGLKDSAIDNLCQLLNCTKEAAEEVIANWKQYYNE